ncbi:MAG: hypothetical protein VR65_12335 [Desulfobulbaceae bacterium BRH_c16a]|nr:MAG: hypothetical protein VR65_12335 [Desulfobulbaceae bacterium BRH_c16a]
MMTPEGWNERNSSPDLTDKLARLRQPDAYPERPESIEVLETHMSLLFLTKRHVYKMKKPVCNPYVDFRTVQARRHHCREEVRLNRRLAVDVYHGIVPLAIIDSGRMQLAGEGRRVDWLVKMRRLPAERMLDRLIDRDLLVAEDIDRLGNVLTGFYSRCPPIALDRDKYVGRMEKALETDRQALVAAPYDFSDRYIPVLQALRRFIVNHRKMLERRVAEKRIVEGHGDLRPEHICLEPLPVIFDCLVFDYHLRLIDPVDELAFLAMGCARLGVDWVEEPLFQSYTACTGDAPPPLLVAFFKCYRACLWTRLACWRMEKGEDDHKWHRRAEEYLRLAVQYSDEMT